MKKLTLFLAVAVLMSTFFTLFSGCATEQVDEEDMSRWIVRFTSPYTTDLNGYKELSIEELEERNFDNNFTITVQWRDEYLEAADRDPYFRLTPDTTIYYINDAGERIENGALNDDKYYVVWESDEKYTEDGGLEDSLVFYPGKYRIEYALKRNTPGVGGFFKDYLTTFYIDLIIGNITK